MLTVERVVKYIVSDGKEFTDRGEAERYEKRIEIEIALRETLSTGMATGRIDAVISVMVTHAPEVRDILNKHIRRQPKKS